MRKKTVLYAGNFCVPDGNAAGKRVFANACALRDYGYDVVCFGFHFNGENRESRTIDGIRSVSLRYENGIKRIFNSFYLREFEKILDASGGDRKIGAVILYSAMGSMRFNAEVIRRCRKRGIKTVYDFTDFYDKPDRNNLLKYFLKKSDNHILKRHVLRRADGVIAISSFGKLFCANPRTIIVPPLTMTHAARDPETLPEQVTFSFASVITDKNRPLSEWKDRIDAIIDAFYQVLAEGCGNFQIQFIGFDEEHFIRMLQPRLRSEYREKIKALDGRVRFLGVMSNTAAQQFVAAGHYAVLNRKRMICTNVGFPTKVSEAIALGVPVISNISSDIAYYIEEGRTGFLIDDPEHIDNIARKLIRILRIPRADYMRMANSLSTHNPFYYGLYREKLGDFIGSLQDGFGRI